MKPIAEDSRLILTVTTRMAFLPVVTTFVEQTARAMTLANSDALALTLAAEEVFAYLCRLTTSGRNLTIRCTNTGYGVRTDFSFSAANFSLRAFNLTATVSADDTASLDEMGLLIASRSVDRFEFSEDRDHMLHLSLIREKRYPKASPAALPPLQFSAQFRIIPPDSDSLKAFSDRVLQQYPETLTPPVCHYPGKLVDMVSSGHMDAALAVDASGGATDGMVTGGILWTPYNQHTAECLGPFVFNPPAANAIAEALIDACLNHLARTSTVALICRLSTPELPPGYFESLGTLSIQSSGGAAAMPVYFRQLREDPGARVWGHADIEAFLNREYERLCLPRHISTYQDAGETLNAASVLSTVFDRSRRRVTLKPVRPGADMVRNIEGHIGLLRKESITDIFLEMDTGVSWQPAFVPGLLRNGFIPRVVIPYGGIADLIVFQWEAAPA